MSIIISYDLCKPTQNYDGLIAKIKSYGTYARITESCWFIKTTDTCTKVRDTLTKEIDSNDRLFVAALTGIAAWKNVICSNSVLLNNLQ